MSQPPNDATATDVPIASVPDHAWELKDRSVMAFPPIEASWGQKPER
jgi:hypothetical protein